MQPFLRSNCSILTLSLKVKARLRKLQLPYQRKPGHKISQPRHHLLGWTPTNGTQLFAMLRGVPPMCVMCFRQYAKFECLTTLIKQTLAITKAGWWERKQIAHIGRTPRNIAKSCVPLDGGPPQSCILCFTLFCFDAHMINKILFMAMYVTLLHLQGGFTFLKISTSRIAPYLNVSV